MTRVECSGSEIARVCFGKWSYRLSSAQSNPGVKQMLETNDKTNQYGFGQKSFFYIAG